MNYDKDSDKRRMNTVMSMFVYFSMVLVMTCLTYTCSIHSILIRLYFLLC